MLGCVPKLLTRLSETSLICEDRQGTGSISEDDIPVMRPFLTVIFQSFPEFYKLLHLLLKGICSLRAPRTSSSASSSAPPRARAPMKAVYLAGSFSDPSFNTVRAAFSAARTRQIEKSCLRCVLVQDYKSWQIVDKAHIVRSGFTPRDSAWARRPRRASRLQLDKIRLPMQSRL